MSTRPETRDVIAFLKSLLAMDPWFISNLVKARFPCNYAMSTHPAVQVGRDRGEYVSSFIGVLNGFLGIIEEGPRSGWGPIAVIFDGDTIIDFVETSLLPSP